MGKRDVWDFYENLDEESRDGLSATELAVAAVCDLRQEVNAGGFDSYFRYTSGNTAPQAVATLPTLLGPEWAAVLTEAVNLFGDSYPLDPDSRADWIDERELDDELDALDDRLYALEESTDADKILSKALKKQVLPPT